jgi:hypothetical protein
VGNDAGRDITVSVKRRQSREEPELQQDARTPTCTAAVFGSPADVRSRRACAEDTTRWSRPSQGQRRHLKGLKTFGSPPRGRVLALGTYPSLGFSILGSNRPGAGPGVVPGTSRH